jgi:hypothetical protein
MTPEAARAYFYLPPAPRRSTLDRARAAVPRVARAVLWTAVLAVMVCDIERRWQRLPPNHVAAAVAALHAADTEGVNLEHMSGRYATSVTRLRVAVDAHLYANHPRARNANGSFVAPAPPLPYLEACHANYASWRRSLSAADYLALAPVLRAAADDDARAAAVQATRHPLVLPPWQQCPHPGCGAWRGPWEADLCCGGGQYVVPLDQFPREPPEDLRAMYGSPLFAKYARFFNMRTQFAARGATPGRAARGRG